MGANEFIEWMAYFKLEDEEEYRRIKALVNLELTPEERTNQLRELLGGYNRRSTNTNNSK